MMHLLSGNNRCVASLIDRNCQRRPANRHGRIGKAGLRVVFHELENPATDGNRVYPAAESLLDIYSALGDADLTRQHKGEPLGERIIVSGKVLDENGRPAPNVLVEIWQANAAGRYNHVVDQHEAPIDPNFTGAGRFLTDAKGRYRFVTIRPGEYPWRNHYNAWRPAHIHFSLFGPAIVTRLITQMYFPGDPLLAYDPIYHATPEGARFSYMERDLLAAGVAVRDAAGADEGNPHPASIGDGGSLGAAKASDRGDHVGDLRPRKLREHRQAQRMSGNPLSDGKRAGAVT